MLMQRHSHILVLTLLLAGTTGARADWIENYRIGSWWNQVGDNSAGPYGAIPYIGQTFQALGGVAQSLEIAVHPYDPLEPSMRFHLLITTLQPNGHNPGTILFESNTIAAPAGQLSKIAINLDGVPLTAGQTYAFVLDFFTPGKGGQGGVVSSNPALDRLDDYPHGSVIYPPYFSLFDQNGKLFSTSRADHFNGPWFDVGSTADLAFRMQFGPSALSIPDATITPIWFDPRDAPEPSSLVLCAVGAVVVCFAFRWLPRRAQVSFPAGKFRA
jgi:hypothetical protein